MLLKNRGMGYPDIRGRAIEATKRELLFYEAWKSYRSLLGVSGNFPETLSGFRTRDIGEKPA